MEVTFRCHDWQEGTLLDDYGLKLATTVWISFYSDPGTERETRVNDAMKSLDFMAEKATNPFLNPVASFGGDGKGDALRFLEGVW